MGRQNAGTYGVRVQGSKGGVALYWSLGIPKEFVEVIPGGMRFRPELTDEGILYRPIDLDEAKHVDPPTWAKP